MPQRFYRTKIIMCNDGNRLITGDGGITFDLFFDSFKGLEVVEMRGIVMAIEEVIIDAVVFIT